jgi:hypothetical protein
MWAMFLHQHARITGICTFKRIQYYFVVKVEKTQTS